MRKSENNVETKQHAIKNPIDQSRNQRGSKKNASNK